MIVDLSWLKDAKLYTGKEKNAIIRKQIRMSTAKELRTMIAALEIRACYCLELESDVGCTIHTLVDEILDAWDRHQDDKDIMRHQDKQSIRGSYE